MIGLFVIKLATGITLMWLLMPRKEVTDGFFRIQMRLLLGLTVLAALMLSTQGTWQPLIDGEQADSESFEESAEDVLLSAASQMRTAMIALSVIAYVGSILWAIGRRTPGNISIYLLCAGSVIALMIHSWSVPNQVHGLLQSVADLSSAAVLGSMITGMLLGHWYLTTPTMSIRPLWWFGKAIIVAASVRLLISGWCVSSHGIPSHDASHWIWLLLRWVGGIVVPLIVAVLVFRILRYRNTQSATGVLFAGLILVFMGEMTSALLERSVYVPY